jgi:hypothetical protein
LLLAWSMYSRHRPEVGAALRRRPSAQLWMRLRPLIRLLNAPSKMRSSNFGAALYPLHRFSCMPVRASYSRQPTLSPPLNPPCLCCLVSRVMAAILHVLQVATCAPVTPIPKLGALVYVTTYPCQLFSTSIGWLFSFLVITRIRLEKMYFQWSAEAPASQRHEPCTPRISGPNGYLCHPPSLRMWSTDTNM